MKHSFAVGSAAVLLVALSGCNYLPALPEMKVVDTKAPTEAQLQPNVDPLDVGTATPMTVPPINLVVIERSQQDQSFSTVNETINRDRSFSSTEKGNHILVNGQRLVDEEGDINAFSRYSDTGSITYFVRDARINQADDGLVHYKIKLLDVRTPGNKPKLIGEYAHNSRVERVSFDNQPAIALDKFILTSNGLVLFRDDGTIVTQLIAGEPAKTWTIPEGFKAATFDIEQDVGFSRHIPILQHRGVHKLFGVLPSDKEELYDIGFFNLQTGKITALAKDVVINTQTEQTFQNYVRGQVVIKNTASGPIAVTTEDTLHAVVARNLATLTKTTLSRTEQKLSHGFAAGIDKRPAGGLGQFGKMYIEFQPGNGDMTNKRISDLEAYMKHQG